MTHSPDWIKALYMLEEMFNPNQTLEFYAQKIAEACQMRRKEVEAAIGGQND